MYLCSLAFEKAIQTVPGGKDWITQSPVRVLIFSMRWGDDSSLAEMSSSPACQVRDGCECTANGPSILRMVSLPLGSTPMDSIIVCVPLCLQDCCHGIKTFLPHREIKCCVLLHWHHLETPAIHTHLSVLVLHSSRCPWGWQRCPDVPSCLQLCPAAPADSPELRPGQGSSSLWSWECAGSGCQKHQAFTFLILGL